MTTKLIQNRWVKYSLPSWLYAIMIFIFSSVPHLSLPPIAGHWTDKLVHFIEYAIFGWLLARSFRHSASVDFQKNFLVFAVITGTLYGLLDECHQLFVPGRLFTLSDLSADFIGSFLGAFIYRRQNKSFNLS